MISKEFHRKGTKNAKLLRYKNKEKNLSLFEYVCRTKFLKFFFALFVASRLTKHYTKTFSGFSKCLHLS